MNYCILLDAIENRAKIIQVENESILQTAYHLMDCDTVQLVPLYPDRLPKGYGAVCDEDMFGKTLFFNPLASWLYGCDDHGAPIANNVVIFKVSGEDFVWMAEDEARKIADDLNARADEVFDLTITKAMAARQ